MKYLVLLSLVLTSGGAPILAQTFDAKSTGLDGDLTFTTPGTYTFDPKAFPTPLNPANDGVFNFKTITIGSGVTLKLSATIFNTPVVWLAQGAVKIDGTIDLRGQDGFNVVNTTQRTYSSPGPGGFGGGFPAVGPNPAGAGFGPAGGALPPNNTCAPTYAFSGGFTGNQFLVPLIGGSGGGGAGPNAGGAGGGAILIASNVSITGTGSINAAGGSHSYTGGYVSGPGSGGGIRLVAPTVSISGLLDASGGGQLNVCQKSVSGAVRIEAFTIGAINAAGNYYTGTPYNLFINSSSDPSLKVVSVGGTPVSTTPTGTFLVPDVTVNTSGTLAVDIQAANVPIGTIVTLQIFSENGPDQIIQSTGLTGTLASSTATATIPSLAPGFSKGFVKATF